MYTYTVKMIKISTS